MVRPVFASTAAPMDAGVLRYRTPPIMIGVALKFETVGGAPSRHRSGSCRFNSANTTSESADHSPPCVVVMPRQASAERHRHATAKRLKFPRSICDRGEYLVLPRSPP